jgi:hypothetical protein
MSTWVCFAAMGHVNSSAFFAHFPSSIQSLLLDQHGFATFALVYYFFGLSVNSVIRVFTWTF